ncbi:MAG TPA: HD domain-containing phosphohydrolase [Spirochaetia bacterium]|nr:HD domain-containing phosphohydrolase [Spirochaetia bacterium]
MDDAHPDIPLEQAADVEVLDDGVVAAAAPHPFQDSQEFRLWETSFLTERIPSLFLDASLKILRANGTFCDTFECGPDFLGTYFTQFYSSYFDEKKSGELFRAILSPSTGYMWNGRLEKTGHDQLLNVSKVWILPVASTAQVGDVAAQVLAPRPNAYCAVCLDISMEYRQLLQNTFASLLGAARLKDNDTGHHVERVNRYARVLAEDLLGRPETPQVDRQFIENISLVAALHDMGKIGTPDDILNKAGKLESWEWDVMKQHTTNGAFILSTYPNPMAAEIALRHHERWDGTGYPHGLAGKLIPLPARIVAVTDVYDALRMRRAYKEAMSHAVAVDTMKKERGTHFDPFVIDRFAAISGIFETIFSELSDS